MGNSASEEENSRKPSVKPNTKELINKQRNWFSSFEKTRKESNGNEPIDSVRRSSVKNDHTPSVISGGLSSGSPSPKSLPPDATPTPPSSLNLPRDRRPLSARGSNNSDSIEDYIQNWKKNENGASPELHSPGVESIKSNNSSIPSNKDVEVVKSS